MNKYSVFLIFSALCFESDLVAQNNPYGLKILYYAGYMESVKKNPEKQLVDLERLIPGIVLDIKYATVDNFTKQKIYEEAKAFARKSVAQALLEAQKDFLKLGYRIKIFDAYRPYSATVKFYEIYKDTRYVASPKKGSRHNKGCAIDLTLVEAISKKELEFPTKYDSFRKEAWADAKVSDPTILKNRTMLISTLTKHGFKVNSTEWWHFDYLACQNFEILDIPFEELI